MKGIKPAKPWPVKPAVAALKKSAREFEAVSDKTVVGGGHHASSRRTARGCEMTASSLRPDFRWTNRAFETVVRRRGTRRFIRSLRRATSLAAVDAERRAVIAETIALASRDGPVPDGADKHVSGLFDDLIAIEF